MALSEFTLIKRFFEGVGIPDPDIKLGIGDDCALLSIPSGMELAVSIDTLVENVHFPADTAPDLLAARALSSCLSDLAAMGATPRWITLALTLPEADEVWLEAFSRSLAQQAVHYGVSLVGGDTTRGPLCLSIQVHGLVPVGCALRRDGAAPGDLIYVSGHLGDSAAGLDQIQNRAEPNPYLTARFYRPEPRFDVAELLLGFASAAIDVSDGLLADLGHILTRSGVGAELDPARLPLSESILNLYSAEQTRRWALSGGEDFELCFTVPVSRVDKLEQALAERSILCTRVGMITSGSGIKLLQSDGRLLAVAADGYRHFK